MVYQDRVLEAMVVGIHAAIEWLHRIRRNAYFYCMCTYAGTKIGKKGKSIILQLSRGD